MSRTDWSGGRGELAAGNVAIVSPAAVYQYLDPSSDVASNQPCASGLAGDGALATQLRTATAGPALRARRDADAGPTARDGDMLSGTAADGRSQLVAPSSVYQ